MAQKTSFFVFCAVFTTLLTEHLQSMCVETPLFCIFAEALRACTTSGSRAIPSVIPASRRSRGDGVDAL